MVFSTECANLGNKVDTAGPLKANALPIEFINLTSFRLMRTLRPLRMISHNEGMRVLVAAIGGALIQCVQVLILLSFGFVVFGITGLQLFNGATHQAGDGCRS